MALQSNALTTVDNFMSYSGGVLNARDMILITNDTDSGSTTTATVQVTSSTILLNTNVTNNTLTLATYASITALVAAIDALNEGWDATVLSGAGGGNPTDLDVVGSQNSLSTSIYLSGLNKAAVELAINAASDAIELYCGRTFASTLYSQRYTGHGFKRLTLRNRPIISIDRLSIGREEVMSVTNSSTDAATSVVEVTSTSVDLETIGGANSGTDSLTFAANTTVTTMVAAINALGAGWSASAIGSKTGTWSTTRLLPFSPRSVLGFSSPLFMPTEDVSDYDVQKDVGYVTLRGPRGGFGRLDYGSAIGGSGSSGGLGNSGPIYPLTGDKIAPFWPVGTHNIYIEYTAGYATIPSDLVQICHELSVNFLSMGSRETGLASESVDGYSYTSGEGPMPKSMRERLYRYKDVVANMDYVDA